ncbi:MAG TPA: hypothetical protein VF266_01010 [Thermoanaerobaculia bacterium]
MNPAKLSRTLAAALLVSAVLAVPASAAKRRSVAHRSPGVEFTVNISGVVLDNVTGQPVVGVELSTGQRFDATDTQGRFDLKNATGHGSILVEAKRSGYLPFSTRITPGAPTALTIRLTPTPTVTVRLTNGEVKNLDNESLKFGYPLAFTGYIESESEDFCKIADSSKVSINKSQMARLVGPAQIVPAGSCCTDNAAKMTLTLKNGEVHDVLFTDTCQERYKVDIGGREHVSGQFVHLLITDVAEVIFP